MNEYKKHMNHHLKTGSFTEAEAAQGDKVGVAQGRVSEPGEGEEGGMEGVTRRGLIK